MPHREPTDSHLILLVDDDQDILDALGTLLEVNGVVVERAPSAFSALRKLEAGLAPCLVLLDIRMPGMSGWDLWAWMRREPFTAGIPVAMISGENQDRAEAQAKGVLDVLKKPVEIERILDLVHRVCDTAPGTP